MILFFSQANCGRAYVFTPQKGLLFLTKLALNNGISTITCHTNQSWQDAAPYQKTGALNG